MKNNVFILIILLQLLFEVVNAQSVHTLTYHKNKYRASDVIVKQQLKYIEPGMNGENLVWDFSDLELINEKYRIDYFSRDKSDSNFVSCYEHNTFYHYSYLNDTLWLNEYNNRSVIMKYHKPEAYLRFPFEYGDTLISTFFGTGVYYQRLDLIAEGRSIVVADAAGSIITPERDTLTNILRVSRLKEYINVGMDSSLITVQSYHWYKKGERYPIFETIKSFEQRNDTVINGFSTSFYFTEISREQLPYDLANIVDEEAIYEESTETMILNCEIFPNPVISDMQISYELSASAKVSYFISDVIGRPWLIIPSELLDAGTHTRQINLTGYPIGEYALNIVVNDKVFRRTVIKN